MQEKQKEYLFPPYLPEDNNSIQDSSSAEGLTVARSELERLLQEKAENFWRNVTSNKTLSSSLDSYLQHARCRTLHNLPIWSLPL